MFWKILFAAVLLLCGFSPPPSDPCGHWQASHAFAPLTAAAAAPVPTSVSRDMNLGSEPLSSGNSHTDSSSSRRSLMAFQRQLQQTASNVTVVTTAEQLQAAVVLGAVHIEGNCSTPMPTSASLGLTPTAAPLQPVKPRQCLVISDWSLFEVVGSRVWLEGLYIRMVTSRGGAAYPIDCVFADFTGWTVVKTENAASASFVNCMFANNTVIPQDGGSAVIVQDVWTAELDADGALGSNVRLEGCTFTANSPTALPMLLADHRGAPVDTAGDILFEDVQGVFYSNDRLRVCTYEGEEDAAKGPTCKNSRPRDLADSNAGWFINDRDAWLLSVQEELRFLQLQGPSATAPLSDAALSPSQSPFGVLFFEDDFKPLAPSPAAAAAGAGDTAPPQEVTLLPAAVATRDAQDTASGETAVAPGSEVLEEAEKKEKEEKEERDRTIWIASVSATAAAAVIGLLLACVGVIVFRRRRRHSNERARAKKAADAGGEAHAFNAPRMAWGNSLDMHGLSNNRSNTPPGGSHDHSSQERSLALGSGARSTPTLANGTMSDMFVTGGGSTDHATAALIWSPRKTPPHGIPGDNSLAACMRFIHQQLDCFGPERLLLGHYQLLGQKERRTGGQGVIQFARRTEGTTVTPYALKFFARYAEFKEEAAMYRDAPDALRRFMPTVVKYAANEDGSVRDPFGNPMPPFLVMEKGECLSERTNKSPVDTTHAAQVLANVSEIIAELHEAGYAHRDLKPANIMWQPRTFIWVLIDFGLASKIGKRTPIGFTPTYAAPEVIKAHLKGKKNVVADSAVDSWALGLIALELLTGRPAFPSSREVYEDLTDPSILLPWEKERITDADRDALGELYSSILRLVHRDPRKRITAREFSRNIRELLSQHEQQPKPSTSAHASAAVDAVASDYKPLQWGLEQSDESEMQAANFQHTPASSIASAPARQPCAGHDEIQQQRPVLFDAPAIGAAAAAAPAPQYQDPQQNIILPAVAAVSRAPSEKQEEPQGDGTASHSNAAPKLALAAVAPHEALVQQQLQQEQQAACPVSPPPAFRDMHTKQREHRFPLPRSPLASDTRMQQTERCTPPTASVVAPPTAFHNHVVAGQRQQASRTSGALHPLKTTAFDAIPAAANEDQHQALPPIYSGVESTVRFERQPSTATQSSLAVSIVSAPPTFLGQKAEADPSMRKLSGKCSMRKLYMPAESGGTPSAWRESETSERRVSENVSWLNNSSFVTCESSRFSDPMT